MIFFASRHPVGSSSVQAAAAAAASKLAVAAATRLVAAASRLVAAAASRLFAAASRLVSAANYCDFRGQCSEIGDVWCSAFGNVARSGCACRPNHICNGLWFQCKARDVLCSVPCTAFVLHTRGSVNVKMPGGVFYGSHETFVLLQLWDQYVCFPSHPLDKKAQACESEAGDGGQGQP